MYICTALFLVAVLPRMEKSKNLNKSLSNQYAAAALGRSEDNNGSIAYRELAGDSSMLRVTLLHCRLLKRPEGSTDTVPWSTDKDLYPSA